MKINGLKDSGENGFRDLPVGAQCNRRTNRICLCSMKAHQKTEDSATCRGADWAAVEGKSQSRAGPDAGAGGTRGRTLAAGGRRCQKEREMYKHGMRKNDRGTHFILCETISRACTSGGKNTGHRGLKPARRRKGRAWIERVVRAWDRDVYGRRGGSAGTHLRRPRRTPWCRPRRRAGWSCSRMSGPRCPPRARGLRGDCGRHREGMRTASVSPAREAFRKAWWLCSEASVPRCPPRARGLRRPSPAAALRRPVSPAREGFAR
jgi:hypothetical protein